MSSIPVSMTYSRRVAASFIAMRTLHPPLRLAVVLLSAVLPATAAHAQAQTADQTAAAAAPAMQAHSETPLAQTKDGIDLPQVPTPSPRPDTGPIQWRWPQSLGRMKGRDLALAQGLRLADTTIPWNDGATLPAAKAASKQGGRCLFSYEYATRNIGALSTAATKNSIRRGSKNGAALAHDGLPALAAGADSASIGTVPLAAGTTTLYVYADSIGAVAETSETNNTGQLTVTVTGDCG
jgi:hypothetical protein